MQKTDRSVSSRFPLRFPLLCPRLPGRKQMTAVAQKTVLTGCLAPNDKGGLEQLIANGRANPEVIKTLKCKTVAEGKFRHANYIRNLAPYIVDEPPGLLGDDTAPNPSEASLAALGSCLAVGLHANAVHRGWIVNKLELQLGGDRRRHRLSRRIAAAPRRCRRLGQPSTQKWRGRPALRHSIDLGARRGLRRHRLHGVVPEYAGLVRREFRQPEAGRPIWRHVR